MVLIFVMLVGGSAGSTGGAIKVVRHLLLGKVLRRELRQTLHPEVVMPIRLNGAVVDERRVDGERQLQEIGAERREAPGCLHHHPPPVGRIVEAEERRWGLVPPIGWRVPNTSSPNQR